MNFYQKWLERFNSAKWDAKLYAVFLYNQQTNQFEKCLCSLECAVAYLETMATDFDFEPAKIFIKRGKERVMSFAQADGSILTKKWFDSNFRFAEYNGGNEVYPIYFSSTADNLIYLS